MIVLADIDTDDQPFCALWQVAILISRLQTTTCCDSASLPLRKYENFQERVKDTPEKLLVSENREQFRIKWKRRI